MRAPNPEAPFGLFTHFTEAQWQEIEASLATSGVDIDAVKVGEFAPGKQWWLPPDDPAEAQSLRRALNRAAVDYGVQARLRPFLSQMPTPLQQAQLWQKQVTAIQNALDTIYRTERAYPAGDQEAGPEVRLAEIAGKPVCVAMSRYINELEDRIHKLKAEGTRCDQNARAVHYDYWHELTRLWNGLTGGVGPKSRQRLRRFLLACTPAALFPDLAQLDEQAVDWFLSNRSRPRKQPNEYWFLSNRSRPPKQSNE